MQDEKHPQLRRDPPLTEGPVFEQLCSGHPLRADPGEGGVKKKPGPRKAGRAGTKDGRGNQTVAIAGAGALPRLALASSSES